MVLFLLVMGTPASAATLWEGDDSADFFTASNWDNGLPTLANQGTINSVSLPNNAPTVDANLNGVDVIQAGGTVTATTNFGQFTGNTIYTLTGGTFDQSGLAGNNAVSVQSGASLTMNGATASALFDHNLTAAGTVAVMNGSLDVGLNLIVTGIATASGGNVTTSGSVRANGGTVNWSGATGTLSSVVVGYNSNGTWNHSAGSVVTTGGGDLQIGRTDGSASGLAVFTGGSFTSADDLVLEEGTLRFGLGPGVVTVSDTISILDGFGFIDFLTGSGGSLTVNNDAYDFEALWDGDDLLFDGQSKTDLGGLAFDDTLFKVTTLAGTSTTLSLVPEPSTVGLLVVAAAVGVVLLLRRRRDSAGN